MLLVLAVTALLQQPTWSLSPQPTVRIGEVDAEQAYMFAGVTGALRMSDGRIVVANSGSNEIRVYDARGRHQVTEGRAGSGPGEFVALRSLFAMPADSFIAMDSRNGRLAVYGPGPKLVRTDQVPTIPGAVGRMSDGSYIATIGIAPPDKVAKFEGVIDYDGFALRRRPGTPAVAPATRETPVVPGMIGYDTVAKVKAGQSLVVPNPPSFRQYPFPFGRSALIAVGPTRFYYGDTHSTQLGIYDVSGRRVGSVALRSSGRALTQADIDQWVETEVAKRTNDQAKLDARNAFKQIPPNKRTPEFAALELDDAGNLWVRRYGPPWAPSPDWDVYSADGRALASVRMPARFDPMHIGRDFVLGVSKDELDVERVELYQLSRSVRAGSTRAALRAGR